MIDCKIFFSLASENHEAYPVSNLSPMTSSLRKGKKIAIEQCSENEYRIFGKDFVVECSVEYEMGNTDKETGTWTKIYYASDVTSQYISSNPSADNKKGLDEIKEYILSAIY